MIAVSQVSEQNRMSKKIYLILFFSQSLTLISQQNIILGQKLFDQKYRKINKVQKLRKDKKIRKRKQKQKYYLIQVQNLKLNLIFFQIMSDPKQEKKAGQEGATKKEQKQKQIQKDEEVLKLLEEDEDDFQQFEEDAYDQHPPEVIKTKQWRENWEDEDATDDFATQLKKQLKS